MKCAQVIFNRVSPVEVYARIYTHVHIVRAAYSMSMTILLINYTSILLNCIVSCLNTFIVTYRYKKLGSIDANTGSADMGWDTDQFPMDIRCTTAVMQVKYPSNHTVRTHASQNKLTVNSVYFQLKMFCYLLISFHNIFIYCTFELKSKELSAVILHADFKVVLKQKGIAPGGLNFDAKVRRESTDIQDMFIAHIGKARS